MTGKMGERVFLCIVDSFETRSKFDMRFDRRRRQLVRWVDMIQKLMECKCGAIKMILLRHI